jgi:hypothetical protein
MPEVPKDERKTGIITYYEGNKGYGKVKVVAPGGTEKLYFFNLAGRRLPQKTGEESTEEKLSRPSWKWTMEFTALPPAKPEDPKSLPVAGDWVLTLPPPPEKKATTPAKGVLANPVLKSPSGRERRTPPGTKKTPKEEPEGAVV